jgi:plastocyanin
MRRLPIIAFVPLVLLVAACSGGSGAGASSAAASVPASVAASPSSGGSAGSAGASGGASGGAACASSSDSAAVDVTIADFKFDPATATAAVGDVVGWTNNDSAPHSAVFGDAGCETDTLAQGASGALVFNEPGTYEYVCGIHPNMKGTLEVSG